VSRAGEAPDGAEALDALYWRAEILQALYWMQGEGLAAEVAPVALAEFLVADPATVAGRLERLAADGYLEATGPRYRLSALGLVEGGRSFRDEFADYLRPAHAACGPGCWCRDPRHAGEPCPSTPAPEPTPEAPRGR
jgi:hypothetical protein